MRKLIRCSTWKITDTWSHFFQSMEIAVKLKFLVRLKHKYGKKVFQLSLNVRIYYECFEHKTERKKKNKFLVSFKSVLYVHNNEWIYSNRFRPQTNHKKIWNVYMVQHVHVCVYVCMWKMTKTEIICGSKIYWSEGQTNNKPKR